MLNGIEFCLSPQRRDPADSVSIDLSSYVLLTHHPCPANCHLRAHRSNIWRPRFPFDRSCPRSCSYHYTIVNAATYSHFRRFRCTPPADGRLAPQSQSFLFRRCLSSWVVYVIHHHCRNCQTAQSLADAVRSVAITSMIENRDLTESLHNYSACSMLARFD